MDPEDASATQCRLTYLECNFEYLKHITFRARRDLRPLHRRGAFAPSGGETRKPREGNRAEPVEMAPGTRFELGGAPGSPAPARTRQPLTLRPEASRQNAKNVSSTPFRGNRG